MPATDNLTYCPQITVIIPSRPDMDIDRTLHYLREADYPEDRLEILHAVGGNPSRQRNQAALQARGEILYFLDDDSLVTPNLFRTMAAFFENPTTWGACGPNVAPPRGENAFAQAVDMVWSSPLGVGPKRARYCAVGSTRLASDWDLIGCNLAVRRSAFLEIGGFDENMWPEEENDLVERLQHRFPDGQLWYVPHGIVYRARPSQLGEFGYKIHRYGVARTARLRHRLSYYLSLGVAPALLVAYFVLLLVLMPYASPEVLETLKVPGAVYAALLGLHVLYHSARRKTDPRAILWAMLLFSGTHVVYGAAQWVGLFRRLPAPSSKPIAIRPIPSQEATRR